MKIGSKHVCLIDVCAQKKFSVSDKSFLLSEHHEVGQNDHNYAVTQKWLFLTSLHVSECAFEACYHRKTASKLLSDYQISIGKKTIFCRFAFLVWAWQQYCHNASVCKTVQILTTFNSRQGRVADVFWPWKILTSFSGATRWLCTAGMPRDFFWPFLKHLKIAYFWPLRKCATRNFWQVYTCQNVLVKHDITVKPLLNCSVTANYPLEKRKENSICFLGLSMAAILQQCQVTQCKNWYFDYF